MTSTQSQPAAAIARKSKTTPAKQTVAKKPVTASKRAKAKPDEPAPASPPVAATIKPETKRTILIGLLQRPDGATVTEFAEKLGWLPHTVRAALTGLRKGGQAVERTKSPDGTSVYRLPVKA